MTRNIILLMREVGGVRGGGVPVHRLHNHIMQIQFSTHKNERIRNGIYCCRF